MNVLIVEDDRITADGLEKIFKDIGGINVVKKAYTFHEGFTEAMTDIFDVVIIDIHLGDPQYDGIELCKTIRKKDTSIPIIMVTRIQSVSALEKAFKEGANDYITKPYNRKELAIRTKRWMKMMHTSEVKENIVFGDMIYNTEENLFYLGDTVLNLTKKEKNLLRIFLIQGDKVLSTSQLQERLWGDYEEEKGRNIRSNIQKLREALQRETKGEYEIKNIRGEGYQMTKVASHTSIMF